LEKGFYDRFDFVVQQFFAGSCDNEIVDEPDPVDFGFPASVTSFGVFFP
jgi:hypothetical protein